MSSRRPSSSASKAKTLSDGGEWQLIAGKSNRGGAAPRQPIPPPLKHGWNWQSRPASRLPVHQEQEEEEEEEEEEAEIDDDDDDELLSDEFDSDCSQKSHNTLKKSRWFKKFFEVIDQLNSEEVNDPERQWHCPACQRGPGSIDWYRGLQPLMSHAKTKGGKRLRQHRTLARLLDEELRRKGTSVVPPGEAFGRWKGVHDQDDKDVVWPPMVVITNTQLEKDDNDKWIGMGNQELLDYFSDYTPLRARHSYGPQGHRGISLLIFEASARGYLEAERLHNLFLNKGTDRNAWTARRKLFYPGGERLLYGFLATKQDLDVFNQHSHAKSKLKFEIKSYHEMVLNQVRQMSEDNQQLGYYKDKYVKEQRHSKAVEQSFSQVSAKLQQTMEENRIVRQRTKLQHEENQEEMYLQEEFFKEQIRIIHETRDAKEETFERLQQEQRAKVAANSSNARHRTAEISKFIESQDKDMEDYVAQREALMKAHEDKISAMKKRHQEEEVGLEKELDAKITLLMDKYNPKT